MGDLSENSAYKMAVEDIEMNYRAAELARYPLRESSYMNHSSPQQAARYFGSIINRVRINEINKILESIKKG